MNPTAQLLQPEVRELIQEGAYSHLRQVLHDLPFADVAEIFQQLDPAEAAVGFRFLLRDDAAEVFSYLPHESQEALIRELGNEQALRIVEAMSPDDRVRLLDEVPAEVAQRLIASFTPETRKVTQAILGYPPGTIGRLMTPDYISIKPEWTCGRAMEHVRKHGRDAETINVLYVVDEQGHLIDDLRLRQVLLAEPDVPIERLMNRSFYSLRADQPQQEAIELMARYDRTALPVVDSRGVLVGIVTVDDVIDVARAQTTETMQRIGGMQVLDEPFDTASVSWLVRKRAPWLALLFLSELLTSNTLRYFDDQISRVVVLSAFVPAIISSGGNSGSQSSTLVIRALALGEIRLTDWFRVLRRELMVAATLGAMIGGLGFIRISLWGWLGLWADKAKDPVTNEVLRDAAGKIVYDMRVQEHFYPFAAAIMCSLFGVVLWGSIMGAMLPFILKKLKLDPAGSSTPFVATLVDVTGIIIYFTCAIYILRGTLL